MTDLSNFRSIKPKAQTANYTSAHVDFGIPTPKAKRIEQFSFDEWEYFTEEWAEALKADYHKVVRFSGSGDQGLDVVCFISDGTYKGGWDNYQCKHYKDPLKPSDIWVEIGKIIFHSFSGEYTVPRKHYFVGSKGVGTKLAKLLADPDKLKSEAKINWKQYCENKISSCTVISLVDDLEKYFDQFDFSIFSSKSVVELIEGHAKTPHHSVRFGGGLPPRQEPDPPPSEIAPLESRYIQQIFEAYSDNIGEEITSATLSTKPVLESDFLRQRERFYNAEFLRNYARETVPSGTFEKLQDDIYDGVIDICVSPEHKDGLDRMRKTMAQSAQISIASNPLASVIETADKQGICHQLANIDKLKWVKTNDKT